MGKELEKSNRMDHKELERVYNETSKLVDFLIKHESYYCLELLAPLDQASREICQIVNNARSDVLKLQISYLEKAGSMEESERIKKTISKITKGIVI